MHLEQHLANGKWAVSCESLYKWRWAEGRGAQNSLDPGGDAAWGLGWEARLASKYFHSPSWAVLGRPRLLFRPSSSFGKQGMLSQSSWFLSVDNYF